MPPRKARKFGYVDLVEAIDRWRLQAQGEDHMDRRKVLRRLAMTLGVREQVLLRRGFDRAYRQIVEGI